MQKKTIICKYCNKKLYTYSQVSFRGYKSLVKECPKCRNQYIDYRCHELALEGIPQDKFEIKNLIIIFIVGLLIAYRGYYLTGRQQINVLDSMQWILPAYFIFWGAGMVLYAIFDAVRIAMGTKKKHYERMLEDSKKRLEDREYLATLAHFGVIELKQNMNDNNV